MCTHYTALPIGSSLQRLGPEAPCWGQRPARLSQAASTEKPKLENYPEMCVFEPDLEPLSLRFPNWVRGNEVPSLQEDPLSELHEAQGEVPMHRKGNTLASPHQGHTARQWWSSLTPGCALLTAAHARTRFLPSGIPCMGCLTDYPSSGQLWHIGCTVPNLQKAKLRLGACNGLPASPFLPSTWHQAWGMAVGARYLWILWFAHERVRRPTIPPNHENGGVFLESRIVK